MKSKKMLPFTQHLIAFLLVLCMITIAVPIKSNAEGTDNSDKKPTVEHVLNEANNWNISKELIMPGEGFYTEPKYEFSREKMQNVLFWAACPRLLHASLLLDYPDGNEDGKARWYTSKLVRSTAEPSKVVPYKTNTYNVIKMAHDKGDLDSVLSEFQNDEDKFAFQKALKNQVTVNAGYINHTNTPIVLEQVRGGSTQDEGDLYGGEYGSTLIIAASSLQNWGCTIRFYEPYYTISYKDLLKGEEKGLPDRYYVKREKQEIVLPNLVRPGYHFIEWTGGLSFADKTNNGQNTTFSFDWDHNLVNANFGDDSLYPRFESGYTVTFLPNGGTINGLKSAIYELDTKSKTFFDIGKYIPERKGYTFMGWCPYPSVSADKLILNTSTYAWVDQWEKDWYHDLHPANDKYDIQLYAMWKKTDPCANGHKAQKLLTKATTKSDGKIVTRCATCKKTLSTKTIPKVSTAALSSASYTYSGKVMKPSVTVKDRSKRKLNSAYYSVTYSNGRKNVGTYTVTIKLKGNYSGTIKKTFRINPKATSISKLTAAKKAFAVKWKKQTAQTTGYQIQYSTSSKFKSAKTVTISKNQTTGKTISKLSAKKKYYVRIRTYKTVKINGKLTKFYSSWSKTYSIKVK